MVHEHERQSGGLFVPDTLVPSQYFDRVRQRAGRGGEWMLMVAVLEDAVTMYLKHAGATTPQNRQLFADAETWIEAHEPTYVFSFDSICSMLDLSPEYLRRGLRAAKDRARRDAGRADAADANAA